MNPAEKPSQPMQDIAGPPGVGAPAAVVDNIPVKAHQPAAEAPVKEDDELDRIMHDVGQQLKREEMKPAKKQFSLFKRRGSKVKTEAKLHAQPLTPRPLNGQAVTPPRPTVAARPPETAAKAAPPKPAPGKPAKTSSAPVLVITLTVIVTAVLIAAAYYSYKK